MHFICCYVNYASRLYEISAYTVILGIFNFNYLFVVGFHCCVFCTVFIVVIMQSVQLYLYSVHPSIHRPAYRVAGQYKT